MTTSHLLSYDDFGSFELKSAELAEVAGGYLTYGINISCPSGNASCSALGLNGECGANEICRVGINGECGDGTVEINPYAPL